MTASIKLTFNSTEYEVVCQGVQVGWKNNNTSKPSVNGTAVTEVQTHSFENPTYMLHAVQLTESAGTLTYAVLLNMAKNKYDGTNGITLTVDYGITSSTLLVGSDGSTTNIPVVVNSFNFPISITEGVHNNKYVPVLSIVLQETA